MKKISALVLLAALCFSIAMAADSNTAKIDVLVKGTQSWDESPLPAYPAGAPELTVLRVVIPAHTTLPIHKHGDITAGYLAKGHLVVENEAGNKLELRAGDALVEMVGKLHYGHNPGDADAEVILFYAGSTGAPASQPQAAN